MNIVMRSKIQKLNWRLNCEMLLGNRSMITERAIEGTPMKIKTRFEEL